MNCAYWVARKTKTTPYHPESDGLVERFNRTLLMMLAMLAGEHKDDWDDLLPLVMMAYRSSVHESTDFMFGEDLCLVKNVRCLWILACHAGIRTPRRTSRAHMLCGSRTRWKWRLIRCASIRVRRCIDRNDCMISGRSGAYSLWGIG